MLIGKKTFTLRSLLDEILRRSQIFHKIDIMKKSI